MTSDDVLHSMFIPAFRVKQDVVPGRISMLWFEANRTGTFDLYCTEYCGNGHAQMVGQVIVYEEDEFDAAMENCRKWIEGIPREGLHMAGARLYSRCQACHTLGETPGPLAPSLRETHELLVAGGQRRLADGSTVLVDEDYIAESILVPGAKIVEGYANQMPLFQGKLSTLQLQALIEFIRRLDEVELDDRGRPILLSPEEIIEQYGGAADAAGDQPQPDPQPESGQ